ncbi:riboflavin synthase [Podospora conica]|nr:riboflavin synthase [Schizothecium conicum]
MFTGIVEEIGTVLSIDVEFPGGYDLDAVLTLEGPIVTSDAALGYSISVDGVSLTFANLTPNGAFVADVMPGSLHRTALGALGAGSRVNLGRAVRADTRLGGYIIPDPVDAVGTLVRRTPGPRWDDLEFSAPPEVTRYIVEKRSITVSGVSLIPTTLEGTILGNLAPGSPVNLEELRAGCPVLVADILARPGERGGRHLRHVQRLHVLGRVDDQALLRLPLRTNTLVPR